MTTYINISYWGLYNRPFINGNMTKACLAAPIWGVKILTAPYEKSSIVPFSFTLDKVD